MTNNLILDPILGPNFFLQVLPLLEGSIVQSHHLMQFKGKLINQTWENGKKKANFGPNFGLFYPDLGPPSPFFFGFYIVWSYPMQLKRKLINQTGEYGKKPNFGPDFDAFWTKFGPPKFFCGFYLY